ncbi:uncharacterized protein LOC130641605 [Hydractinia symbiolongicarpus]|uniref:uncharacterized protein LOC130641605 n=1 Tax=Hydractinia symbiolongicarpus TaxID=13093 RepID=UPI00254C06F7|nr:uncharacterized protein LOC130641605 [Hydractinia symbiolongicarpus]
MSKIFGKIELIKLDVVENAIEEQNRTENGECMGVSVLKTRELFEQKNRKKMESKSPSEELSPLIAEKLKMFKGFVQTSKKSLKKSVRVKEDKSKSVENDEEKISKQDYERMLTEEAEQALLNQPMIRSKNVLKRWYFESKSTENERKLSDDSGVVEEEEEEEFGAVQNQTSNVNVFNEYDNERQILEETEAAFRTFSIKYKHSSHAMQKEKVIQACIRREVPADLNDGNVNVKVMNAENSSLNTSRECKLPNKTTQPPVIVSDYNDEGECVPEGIITNRLMLFQKIAE